MDDNMKYKKDISMSSTFKKIFLSKEDTTYFFWSAVLFYLILYSALTNQIWLVISLASSGGSFMAVSFICRIIKQRKSNVSNDLQDIS